MTPHTSKDLQLTASQRQAVDRICNFAASQTRGYNVGSKFYYANTLRMERTLDRLSIEGGQLMDHRFGTGWPEFHYQDTEDSRRQLGYNNGWHARAFARSAGLLGEAMGYTLMEQQVDRLVAMWHDVVQDNIIFHRPRLGEDELYSVIELIKRMHQQEIDECIAQQVIYGILGTWVVTDSNEDVVGQWGAIAPDDYYPSKAAKRAAQVAATCDLGSLYAPEGPYMSHMLYAQRQGKGPHETPSPEGLTKFTEGQLVFLADHRYPIAQANEIFTGLRPEILKYNMQLLKQLQRGNLDWEQLLEQDREFARQHTETKRRLATMGV